MNIISHNMKYRGFELGYSYQTPGNRPTWYAAWKTSVPSGQHGEQRAGRENNGWYVVHVLAKDLIDTIRLARECIDFNCAVEAEELVKGSELTSQEMTVVANSLKGTK